MNGGVFLLIGFVFGSALVLWLTTLFGGRKQDTLIKELKDKKKALEAVTTSLREYQDRYSDLRKEMEKVEDEKINFNVNDLYKSIKNKL